MEPTGLRAPAIAVRGLGKSFKDVQVLRGVDFEVAAGTIFALLGSNGAGKTTVVRILSTLLKPDAGAAAVNGFDVALAAEHVRESISLTGQFAAVDEVLTGRENLVLIARLRHLKEPQAIADGLLERFALLEAGGRKVGGVFRRHAAPSGHCHEPHWKPAGHFSGRAHHGPGPAGAAGRLGGGKAVGQKRHHRAAHHAVPG